MDSDGRQVTGGDRAWAGHAGGPADPCSLSALATADSTTLTGPELVDAIVASEKALSLLSGVQMRLLTALAKPFVAGDPRRLAARLARKNCIARDDSAEMIESCIPEAAASLAAAEVAAALRISPVTAGNRVREADAMTSDLAPTREAMEEGVIDRGKARVIAEHCNPLAADHTAAVQELVLAAACRLTTSELREIVGQAVITVDPEGAQERHEAAAARRDLALKALPDAMAMLRAILPADGAVKIFQISDLLATSTAGSPGDARGIGARRVDALVDIADHLLTHGHLDLSDYLGRELSDDDSSPRRPSGMADEDHLGTAATTDPAATACPRPAATTDPADTVCPSPAATSDAAPDTASTDEPSSGTRREGTASNRIFTRQGRRPHLSVTMGLGTLAGLDELPGSLAGFGAIPAGLARSIAASAATINALLADPRTGVVLQAGALTYRPSQELRDQVAALLGICQFPSCRQPSWRCDIDHRDTFDRQHPEDGGRTTLDNCATLCRRHHLFKHHTEWRVRPDRERMTLHWVSPTGHSYSKQGRQAAPPEVWVSTPGAAVAERLDAITATAAWSAPPCSSAPHPTGRRTGSPPRSRQVRGAVEEFLTAILLRHGLNTPILEYVADETAWDAARSDTSPSPDEPPGNRDPGLDDPNGDAPPF